MKSFISLIGVILFASIFFAGCGCNDKCENGGICTDGACECVDGFTGKLCESSPAKELDGSFSVTDNCSGQLSLGGGSYTATITASDFDAYTLSFDGLLGFSSKGVNSPIAATISGSDVSVTIQVLSGSSTSYYINGIGTALSADQLSLTIQVNEDISGYSCNCSVNFNRN